MPLSSQARPGSGDSRATAPVVAGRERRLLAAARGAAAVTLAGTMFSPPLANVGAFVTLLCFALLPSARTRLGQVLAQPLGRAALLLWAALAVATLWSDAPPMERIRDWWDWRPLLLLVIGLAIFDDEVARRRALLAFIGAATVGAAYSFWAWAHGYATVPQGDAAPGHVMRNTVTQSIVLALACFFALGLAARGHWLGRRVRFALGAAALALLANLVFVTSGRTGHLLLLILLLGAGLQLLDGWRRVAAIVAVPLLAALAVAVSPLLQTRFTMAVDELRAPLASEQMTSMGIRSVMWQVSWQMLRERPLLGYGMGGFGPAYEKVPAGAAAGGSRRQRCLCLVPVLRLSPSWPPSLSRVGAGDARRLVRRQPCLVAVHDLRRGAHADAAARHPAGGAARRSRRAGAEAGRLTRRAAGGRTYGRSASSSSAASITRSGDKRSRQSLRLSRWRSQPSSWQGTHGRSGFCTSSTLVRR